MSETAELLELSATPAPAADAPPADSANAIGQSTPDWSMALPDDMRGWVETKGWKDPSEAIKSYRELEKFVGAEKAGRAVVLPKDENDAEGRENLYKALGRPDKPEEYALAEVFGDLPIDGEMLNGVATGMHQAGLSAAQAKAVATVYQEQMAAQEKAMLAKTKAETDEILREWGPAKERNLELAKRGAAAMGLSGTELSQLEMLIGSKHILTKLAKLGEAFGEDKNIKSDADAGFNFSPVGAHAKIEALMADSNFSARYMNGDKAAHDQIAKLSEIAIKK